MTELVLDTGALVGLQRDHAALLALLGFAERRGIRLRTSPAALAEFLGGSPRDLRGAADWLASAVEVGAIDEALGRRAATLMRAALDGSKGASPGAIDALVAAEAERRGCEVVISGDRKDFDALSAASGQFKVIDLEDVVTP